LGGDQLGIRCPRESPQLHVAPAIIAALAHRIDAKLILGIDLVSHKPSLVAPEVQTLVGTIDPGHPARYIDAFEIGNEPDRYPRYDPRATVVGRYFQRYLSDFTDWAHLIRLAAHDPKVGIAGPGLGRFGLPWITGTSSGDFGEFLRSPPRPRLITFHRYAILRARRCQPLACPSIANLILNGFSQGLAGSLLRFIKELGPGRRLRVDEMNSVTGGGVRGVSNTFASALWALDTLFALAQAGVIGVNVHTFPGAGYALYSGPRGGWRVFPEYYGLLAFARAAPAGSRLLAVRATDAAALADPQVRVWATAAPSGTLTTVVINKTVRTADVELSGSGVPARSRATVTWLKAPRTGTDPHCSRPQAAAGLCATGGVTFGGASFGPRSHRGGDRTLTGALRTPARRTCRRLVACTAQRRGPVISLVVPGGTAVLVSGPGVRTRHGRGRAARRQSLRSAPAWIGSSRARTSAPA
jgi:hypothetical protein